MDPNQPLSKRLLFPSLKTRQWLLLWNGSNGESFFGTPGTTSFVHEYGADTFFKEMVTGQFFAIISNGVSRSFANIFLLHRPCNIINLALSLIYILSAQLSAY